jgi:serine-type D-Ala-D-Ala carboxypeptidase
MKTTMETSLYQAIKEKIFPGGISSFIQTGKGPETAVAGKLSFHETAAEVTLDTIYDLASLTKVTATLPAILLSIQKGKLLLFDRVEEYIPEFCTGHDQHFKRNITIFHLLTHTSGLPAWRPFFVKCRGTRDYIEAIAKEPLMGRPGKKVVYSDLGFMLLGFILERVWDLELAELTKQLVFQPLSMKNTGYLSQGVIAPTENGNEIEKNMALEYLKANKRPGAFTFMEEELVAVPWRKEAIQGTVHDCNAFYGLNGVSGHAGLFSTICDLQKYMKIWSETDNNFLDPLLKKLATEAKTGKLAPMRGLGWESASTGGTMEQLIQSCSAGDLVSPAAFGHTGFTGTFMWHDPVRESTLIVLSNRVHPHGNGAIINWRKKQANIVFGEAGLPRNEGRTGK